jgi:TPR repeat protein
VDALEDIVSQKKMMYTFGMVELQFKEGEGAKQKKAERDWMTRHESMLLLAKFYLGGRGIDANPGKSNQYYLECLLNEAQQRNLVAAQGGDAQAQFRIGYILLDGTEDGAQRSISDSAWRGDFFRTPGFIGWSFKQYCDNGYLRTALKLDYAEQREKRKEAIKWITMAAEQGDLQAQAWLSDIHIHYEDFRNYEQAFRWARKAAVRGNAGALVVLSKLSLEGRGMPKDEIEAYAYINLAASKDEAFRGYFNELESRLPANVRFAGQQRTKQLQKELEDEDLQRVLNADKDKSPKKGA